RELLGELRPYKVRPSRDTVPERWETGTLPHESLAGLIAAVDYIASLTGTGDRRPAVLAGMETIRVHESELSTRFLEGVRDLNAVRLYGIADTDRIAERTPTFAIRVGDEPPEETANRFAERGIYVW